MEIERDKEYEEMENDDGSIEVSETVEETSEHDKEIGSEDEEAGTEGEETGEENEDESGDVSSVDESFETQVLVEVDSNHDLSAEINTFSYETVVLTIIVVILGIMAIGGFSHE